MSLSEARTKEICIRGERTGRVKVSSVPLAISDNYLSQSNF
jgi:hypothetical protein